MKNKYNYICFVDIYGTGYELAKKFINSGFKLIHISSSESTPEFYFKSFDSKLFEFSYCCSKDGIESILKFLKKLNVKIVLAGGEIGVPMADLIASKLNLPGNSPENSNLRRNKYEMNEAVRSNGLLTVKQELANNLDDALEIVNKFNTWPLVLKPVDSASTENVFFCYSIHEVKNAFSNIFLKKNMLGFVNFVVLIQEKLNGQKYVVNAISIKGNHKITDIWKEDRMDNNIYDREILIPYEGNIQKTLIEYTKNVLNAVGVKEGASHNEFIMTENGPILIEVGARLAGNIISSILMESLGDSPVNAAFDYYKTPQKFFKNIHNTYVIKKNLVIVNLISKHEGKIIENNIQKKISMLPSFKFLVCKLNTGDFIHKTIDLLTRVGYVYLMHDDIDVIEKDYSQIRDWELQDKLITIS